MIAQATRTSKIKFSAKTA